MTFVLTAKALAITLMVGGAHGAAKYDLQYDLDPGATLTLSVSQKVRFERTVMGNEITTNTKDAIVLGFEAISVGDDGMRFDVIYKDRTHATDSAQYPAGPDFADLVGSHVRISLSPRGVLSEFEGFEDLPEIRLADLDATLGKELYIKELRDVFLELPGKPIVVGEDWTYSREFSEPVDNGEVRVRQNFTYTVVGTAVIDGHECLELEGNLAVTIDGVVNAGGMDLVLKIGGDGEEKAYFAWKKGFILRSDGSARVDGTAENEELGVTIVLSQEFETGLRVEFD